VSEFLKNPVSWLETEILYHSYTTRGEAQEVANGIDRMIKVRAHQLPRANSFLDQSIQAGLLQLAAFSFRTIKYWSGFAGDF
jgi:uncharacterized protein YggE